MIGFVPIPNRFQMKSMKVIDNLKTNVNKEFKHDQEL
jgi:hypothetical protein